MKEMLVSINCITYNHEKYIADTIESFLLQEVDFPIEILIHDDASTDGTQEIIRSYEKQYPEIIKPIYQKENQHSKGVKASFINLERAKGKYVAVCEGDDFWSDPLKLKKQVEKLENNPTYAATFHPAEEINIDKSKRYTFIKPLYEKEKNLYTTKDIIDFDGRCIHISSILYRRASFNHQNAPEFFMKSLVGDLPMMLSISLHGDFYYFNEPMSQVRRGVAQGASQRLFRDVETKISSYKKIMDTYEAFDKYTKEYFHEEIENVLLKRNFEIALLQRDREKVKNSKIYPSLSRGERMDVVLRLYSPVLYRGKNLVARKLGSLYKKINRNNETS